jgi:hypothetical protein
MLVEFPERRESPSAVGLTRAVRGALRPPDRGLIVALIHAHNEQDLVTTAVRLLGEQSSPPDLTIVCADNCLDGTALTAEAAGADVFVTVENELGRPGGLNQALDHLLPLLRDDDAVLILDIESSLDSSFLVEARRRLTEGVGGVGGVYTDLDASEFEGLIKSSQYAPFVRELTRLSANPRVLTGRATLFSVASLWNVVLARAADLLPGDGTGVYNTNSLIPDGELTLALVHLGYSIVAAS